MSTRVRLAAGMGALALAVGSCSAEGLTERVVEEAAEAAGESIDVDLDEQGGGISVEGEDGESFSLGAATEVPDAIAEVVAVPDGFAPQNTAEQTDESGHATTVTGFIPADDPAGLVDDLEAAMTADGWETVNESDMNDELITLMLQRGDDAVTVNVIADGDEATMTLVLLQGT